MTGLLSSLGKFILLGLGCGVFSGLFGVGAGIIMIPALVFFADLTQKSAQGMSLMIMVPMALVGAIRYKLNPDVQGNAGMAAAMALGGVIGALVGASIAVQLPSAILRKLFAAFLLLVAIYMLAIPERARAVREETTPAGTSAGSAMSAEKGSGNERKG